MPSNCKVIFTISPVRHVKDGMIENARSKSRLLEAIHQTTTQNFLNNFNEIVDVIFIDADHSFEAVKLDFKGSLKNLNEFGIIILHDTDPISEKYIDKLYCGDSYKMIDWLKTEHPEMDVFTFPISEAGLTIIKRSSDRRVNKFLNNE